MMKVHIIQLVASQLLVSVISASPKTADEFFQDDQKMVNEGVISAGNANALAVRMGDKIIHHIFNSEAQ